MADLRKRDIVTKIRKLKTGEIAGGIPFTRGPLAHLLRNRFYIGEVVFKGEVLAGEQLPIVDRDLFDAVQTKLTQQNNNHKATRMKSDSLLAGRIYDDRGNRMSPSHVSKRGIKYRYYLSSALIQGRPNKAGSIRRVSAPELEAHVVRTLQEHLKLSAPIDDRTLINLHITRVEIHSDQLIIQLAQVDQARDQTGAAAETLHIPWRKTSSRRRREIL